MRAPDKIYACETDVRGQKEQIWLSYPLSTTDNFEYIRKDALLEWLQKEYETNKWFYETHAKPNELHTGRCEAYKQVIDKLNSM